MEDKHLENMIAALEMFYETNGYEDFYKNELQKRTPEQIYELYEETFGNSLI